MSLSERADGFRSKGEAFFNYAVDESPKRFKSKAVFDFGKHPKKKKKFKSEGLTF